MSEGGRAFCDNSDSELLRFVMPLVLEVPSIELRFVRVNFIWRALIEVLLSRAPRWMVTYVLALARVRIGSFALKRFGAGSYR